MMTISYKYLLINQSNLTQLFFKQFESFGNISNDCNSLIQKLMNEQESQEFLVQVEKLMTSEVASTLWSTNMDLLALTTFDNLVELYRISYKAQRVFQSDEGKPVKSLAFSPDSQLLAYALNDGLIKIVKTENGQRVVIVDGVHLQQVTSLSFLNYQSLDSMQFLPFQKNSMEAKLILNICPHKNCNKNAIIKINYFNQMRKDFSLLLSSQRNKTILLLNGFIPIAEVDYTKLGFQNPALLHCYYDGKLKAIVGDEKQSGCALHLVEYEASVLAASKDHLIKLNCLLGYIGQILGFIEIAYEQAELIARDILRQYNSKINLIDDPNVENLNPCEELFRFLNCGTTSTAVVNFFTKEVYDTKILEKLDQTLNACFAQLHDLLLESVQNSLERATLLLKRLQELASVKEVNGLGISSKKLNAIQARIVRLYTMGEVLLAESTEAKFDIRNLLVWLNKSTIKSAGENQVEIENTKSYLNKYTVDFNRLYSFLAQEKRFKLGNLLSFFTKTNESHSLRLQTPDFRLLSAPEQIQTSPQDKQTLAKLIKLFDVEDVPSGKQQKMQIEESFRSFKIEVRQLSSELKSLARAPLQAVSRSISNQCQITKIGEVIVNELFPLQLRAIVREKELIVYYIQHEQRVDRLVQYNCHQRSSRSLVVSRSHILSLAVADKVILVLQDKMTTQKIVAEVANEDMDGGEIQIGRRISRAQGELDINSSFRGLNSLVIDKNKLIIFD